MPLEDMLLSVEIHVLGIVCPLLLPVPVYIAHALEYLARVDVLRAVLEVPQNHLRELHYALPAVRVGRVEGDRRVIRPTTTTSVVVSGTRPTTCVALALLPHRDGTGLIDSSHSELDLRKRMADRPNIKICTCMHSIVQMLKPNARKASGEVVSLSVWSLLVGTLCIHRSGFSG